MPEPRTPNPGSSAVSGVLNVLKPVGMTSHDVVDAVRRSVRTRRVGHTGTLDPGAPGVLVVCIERATRIAEFLADADKEYRVEVAFGTSTDTGDAYGTVVKAGDPGDLTDETILAGLSEFTGEIEQVPPMASAVQVGGRRLYEAARRGETVDVAPRRVRVYSIVLLEFDRAAARAWVHVHCSKGTYIRRLCHDLGDRLGCGGHAAFMVRTRVGRYRIEHAVTLEELAAAAGRGALEAIVEPPGTALSDLPSVDLSPQQRQAVMHGQGIPLFRVAGWQQLVGASLVRLSDDAGLVAVARVDEGILKPFKVIR
ncbi:MAG: tRNA pseudouridine(55) synthase TruB [bacterium]